MFCKAPSGAFSSMWTLFPHGSPGLTPEGRLRDGPYLLELRPHRLSWPAASTIICSMAGRRNWTGWRRSTNQPRSLIESNWGDGLTGPHVENNDLASSHAERVNCVVHVNNAGEAQLSGRNPLGLSRL